MTRSRVQLRPHRALLLATLLCLPTAAQGQPQASVADRALARDIFRELIAIDTSEPNGNPRAASESLAKRLAASGFTPDEVQIVGAAPRLGNLVVRLRSTSKPDSTATAGANGPVLLMAQLDVVPARRGW